MVAGRSAIDCGELSSLGDAKFPSSGGCLDVVLPFNIGYLHSKERFWQPKHGSSPVHFLLADAHWIVKVSHGLI